MATNHHAQLDIFSTDESKSKNSKDNDVKGDRELDLRPPGSQDEAEMIIDNPDVKIDNI